jgi:hypothetical protein
MRNYYVEIVVIVIHLGLVHTLLFLLSLEIFGQNAHIVANQEKSVTTSTSTCTVVLVLVAGAFLRGGSFFFIFIEYHTSTYSDRKTPRQLAYPSASTKREFVRVVYVALETAMCSVCPSQKM